VRLAGVGRRVGDQGNLRKIAAMDIGTIRAKLFASDDKVCGGAAGWWNSGSHIIRGRGATSGIGHTSIQAGGLPG
jgi:hypothetical protein